MNIYLAGKIAPGDWRHAAVPSLRDSFCQSDTAVYASTWPVLEGALFGANYVGPYFVGCDHSGFHGRSTHGAGLGADLGCCQPNPHEMPSRDDVRRRCMAAVRRCDVFFLWLDSPTAHGSLVELGWAEAMRKRIVITAHPEFLAKHGKDHWFALGSSAEVFMAESPIEVLRQLADGDHIDGLIFRVASVASRHQ